MILLDPYLRCIRALRTTSLQYIFIYIFSPPPSFLAVAAKESRKLKLFSDSPADEKIILKEIKSELPLHLGDHRNIFFLPPEGCGGGRLNRNWAALSTPPSTPLQTNCYSLELNYEVMPGLSRAGVQPER